MSDVIRKTLIESKIQVLQSLQVYLGKEIEMYTKMLEAVEATEVGDE